MSRFLIVYFMFYSTITLSQNKKETVYLLFDTNSKETCKIFQEGEGLKTVPKYRKWYGEDGHIEFRICDELFFASQSKMDTCDISILKEVRLVDIDYMLNKHRSIDNFVEVIFEKIYFLEKISKEKVIQYEVTWNSVGIGVQYD